MANPESQKTNPETLIECGLAVIHPWLCDVMGHLTTRHYAGIFDDAQYQLFSIIGYHQKTAVSEGWGWADVRQEIDYKSELTAGSVVRVLGSVTAIGHTSIQSVFQLIDRNEDRLCALMRARTVCFDIVLRRAKPVPSAIVAQAKSIFHVGAN